MANLVLNGCSVGMMIVGSSSFQVNQIKSLHLRERPVQSKLKKSREFRFAYTVIAGSRKQKICARRSFCFVAVA